MGGERVETKAMGKALPMQPAARGGAASAAPAPAAAASIAMGRPDSGLPAPARVAAWGAGGPTSGRAVRRFSDGEQCRQHTSASSLLQHIRRSNSLTQAPIPTGRGVLVTVVVDVDQVARALRRIERQEPD